MTGRRSLLLALVTIALLAAVAAVAHATTVTRHQNPHYRVTASLTPTRAAVGQRLTISFTVTNTSDHRHTVSIQYELDGPSFGLGAAYPAMVLKPHTSWTTTFTHRATDAGAYKAVIKAKDALGTSHATATASAS